MRRKGAFAVGAALAAVIAMVTALGGSAAPQAEVATRAGCPTNAVASQSAFEAMQAVRRLLIDGKTITAQGHTSKLTPKNTYVNALVKLGPSSEPVAGAAVLRRAAVKRCGAKVADQSWGVEMFYPLAAMASAASGRSFVVKTRDGWRAY